MTRRFVLAILLAVLLVGIGVATIGAPNLQAAMAVFSGEYVTSAEVIAMAEVVAWIVLLAGAGFLMAISIKGAATTTVRTHRRWSRGVLLLVLGLCVLGVGIARANDAATAGCCGNIVEATSLAG